MDLGLKDRVYIVTGATRGLGNATARALAADGAKVVITGRDEKTAPRPPPSWARTRSGVAADNADPVAAQRLVETPASTSAGFDGILISVGGPAPGFVADNTDDQWQSAFESVFLGAVRLARTAAEALGEGGVIGFVLSGSVHEPIPRLTISNGLRPGLAGFAKSLADELGPRGIRVVGVLPARIDTDRVRELDALSGDPRRRPYGERGAHPAAPLRHPGGVREDRGLPALPGRLLSDGHHGAGRRRRPARLLTAGARPGRFPRPDGETRASCNPLRAVLDGLQYGPRPGVPQPGRVRAWASAARGDRLGRGRVRLDQQPDPGPGAGAAAGQCGLGPVTPSRAAASAPARPPGPAPQKRSLAVAAVDQHLGEAAAAQLPPATTARAGPGRRGPR